MSFSSLPPELVLQIIESAVPHTFHSATYKERQQTLCSLSLVSKPFQLIAQPLLLEIVKLKRLDASSLPITRSSEARWLIINANYTEYGDRTKEEQDQFVDSLRVLATATNLTLPSVPQKDFVTILSMSSHHLTYLQLFNPALEPQKPIHLPNLRDLTLYDVSSELFGALVDPQTVPNLRNFALVDRDPSVVGNLMKAKLDRLLPQLETLTFDVGIWIDPRVAFLHSAASRTLVDFSPYQAKQMKSSITSLIHVRLRQPTPHCPSSSHKQFRTHLVRWSAFIERNHSLPLKSIHLDSSLQSFINIPPAARISLTRIRQRNKIDLVFDHSPADYTVDPYISREFIRRQKEQRRKRSEARGS